jgi:uncharacterized RDD family membrane protein YckC
LVSFSAVAQGIPLAFLELHPGEPPSAIISAFGKPSIFLILCFFILICAGLRSNKQALHDLIAGCLVLRKKERHPHP